MQRLVDEIMELNRKFNEHAEGWACPYKVKEFGRRSMDGFINIWRHPNVRLIPPMAVLVLDFITFESDPMVHSQLEYQMPGVGQIWNLLNPCLQFFPSHLRLLKAAIASAAFAIGIYVGRAIRGLLAGRCSVLRSSRAGHLVPLLSVLLCLLATANIWNSALRFGGVKRNRRGEFYEQETTLYLTSGLGVTLQQSAQAIQTWVFCLDFLNVATVLDIILQDRSQYGDWAKFMIGGKRYCLRDFWERRRIVVAWSAFALALPAAIFVIWVKASTLMILREDSTMRSYTISEYERAMILSFTFWFDVCVVCQDWEFPTFNNHLRVALLGTNVALEGRFANYAMMFGVMMVDLKSLVFQVFYVPKLYAEYPDDNESVWVICNRTLLRSAPESLAHAADYTARKEEGCFRGIRKDGWNDCKDLRLRSTYKRLFVPGQAEQWHIIAVLTPILLAVSTAWVLARIIAFSYRELCRQVVTCHYFNFKEWEEDKECQSTAKYDDGPAAPAEGEASGMKPLEEALQRVGEPGPSSASPLILVSCDGIYEVMLPLETTVQVLKEKIFDRQLQGRIPRGRLRLKRSPVVTLQDDQELRSITREGRTTFIYVLAHLGIEDSPAPHTHWKQFLAFLCCDLRQVCDRRSCKQRDVQESAVELARVPP